MTVETLFAIILFMIRETVLSILHTEWPTLHKRFGVKTLALFGSVARGEAGPESDVDLLVEFDQPTGYFGLVRLQLYLQDCLGQNVDIGTPNSLRAEFRQRIEREAIRVA